MNLIQFCEILEEIRSDLDITGVEAALSQLQAALQDVVNSPGDPNQQTRLAQSLEKLKESAQKSQSNNWGAVWRHDVAEFGLGYILAPEIERETDSIIQRNQITPALAAQGIQKLRDRVVEGKNKIVTLIDGLNFLGIKRPSISPDKATVGMFIPRVAIDDNLKAFGSEAQFFDRLLNAFSEILTGHQENIQIQSVSSSDLLIYVAVAPIVVKYFAEAVSAILDCYLKILKIRRLRDGLQEEGLKKEQLAQVEDHAKALMKSCIAKVTKEIVAKSKANDAGGRKHEVKTLLEKLLWGVAQRVDKGYNFDVRASDEAKASEDKALQDAATTINSLRENLRYMNVSGEQILELPGGIDENGEDVDDPEPPAGAKA